MSEDEAQFSSYGDSQYLDNEHAGIEFFYDFDEHAWVIQDMESRKKGSGKLVIRDLVKRVGPDQRIIVSPIIEEETVETLVELGLIPRAEAQKEVLEVTDPEILKELKMARVMQGGGVKVEKITLQSHPPDPKAEEVMRQHLPNVTIKLFGKT